MLNEQQKKEFIISQGQKLRFNDSMDSLMWEYKRLKDEGDNTDAIIDLIEKKVENILSGNEHKWKTTEK